MQSVLYSDPAVQAAIISGLCGVVASVVASVCAILVGKQFINRARLQEKLQTAINDIHFLLQVESEHVQDNGQKIKKRDIARDNGYSWSGKFTPSRVSLPPRNLT